MSYIMFWIQLYIFIWPYMSGIILFSLYTLLLNFLLSKRSLAFLSPNFSSMHFSPLDKCQMKIYCILVPSTSCTGQTKGHPIRDAFHAEWIIIKLNVLYYLSALFRPKIFNSISRFGSDFLENNFIQNH